MKAEELEPGELARMMARLAEEKKAEDVIIMQMSELLHVTDFFVICSGASDRQVKAIAEHIRSELREQGTRALWVDGLDRGEWAVLDYGSVVLHAFRNEERALYQIEKLWKDAPRLSLEAVSEEVV